MSKPDSAMVGVPKYERIENDFYPTEPACTIAIYDYLIANDILSPSAKVFEPACGDGAIVNVFRERGHEVIASDLYPQLEGAPVKDFLTSDFMINRDGMTRPLVITNPPYQQPYIDLFIAKVIDLCKNDGAIGALLMRNEVDCAVGRREFFEECPFFFGKVVLNWRPRWIPGSTGSPRHNYAWYLWGPAHFTSRIAYVKRPKV